LKIENLKFKIRDPPSLKAMADKFQKKNVAVSFDSAQDRPATAKPCQGVGRAKPI
jgi:hypothetical protein